METVTYKVISDQELKLDLYLPKKKILNPVPLIVWIHGGAWERGSKDDLLIKNKLLCQRLLNEGYAVATLNYRLSGEAIFPAQVADVNSAINYLMKNADAYSLKHHDVVVMGRSAGGHLASLISTSNNVHDTGFYPTDDQPAYHVVAAVVFFAPSDLTTLKGNSGKVDHDASDSAEAKLLGVSPRKRPDLAEWASPTTYVTKNTPPFLIFHGDNDQVVPLSQSQHLQDMLNHVGVTNMLCVASGAHHGDSVFDTEKYVSKVITFVKVQFH